MGTAKQVADAIRAGVQLADREFDKHLPEHLRKPSGRFWTPLVVVQRVSEWLAETGVSSLVDIGCGPGKYAVATALATPTLGSIVGIEHRDTLVDAARTLARLFDVDDYVTFVHGDLSAIPRADCYYLYNPFAENEYVPTEWLDDTIAHSREKFAADVEHIEDMLEAAPLGTRVVVYNGFGGKLPAGYAQTHVDRYMPNILRMFERTR